MSGRVFEKSRSVRVQAVLSVIVLASLLGELLAPPAAPALSLTIVGALLAVALLYLGSAFGDRFVAGEGEVRYENRLLRRLRIRHERTLRFEDIRSLREHRGRTLFIRDGSGARFVVDAVADYVELRDHILHGRSAARASEERTGAPRAAGESLGDVGPRTQRGVVDASP